MVVASHFDDFFRPPDAPLGFATNVNFAAWPEEIEAVSRDFAVRAMKRTWGPLGLHATDPDRVTA
jgi:hypothetical protein